MMAPLQVLVVDDEAPARERLCTLVRRTDGVSVHQACSGGRAALECILRDAPDLVFLDTQMPDVTGLDVARTLGPDRMPPVVFVASHDQHAVDAFDLDAVDYLMKPFDDARFARALRRAREHIRHRSLDALSGRMLDVLQMPSESQRAGAEPLGNGGSLPVQGAATAALAGGAFAAPAPGGVALDEAPSEGNANADGSCAATAPAPRPLGRIAVQRRDVIELVPIAEVRFFEADGSYVKVHTSDQTYLIRERMKRLEARLPAHRFCRIHRSTIVHLPEVTALEPTEQGDVKACLSDGTRLRVSRGRREALEDRLGVL